jgi:hypothetical protein
VQQEGTELVTEPEGAVGRLAERLDVEVAPGEQATAADGRVDGDCTAGIGGAIGHDLESDLVVGVAEAEEHLDPDGPGAARAGHEIGADLVDGKHVVGRVGLGPEPVVGHHEVLALPRAEDGREALHRLASHERGYAAVGGLDELTRRGADGEGVSREHGQSVERGGMAAARRQPGAQRDREQAGGQSLRYRADHESPPV